MSILVLNVSLGIATSQPDLAAAKRGKLSLVALFSQGYGEPSQLLEVLPGKFTGVAASPSTAQPIFLLDGTGALSSIYAFPNRAYPYTAPVQAVNGQIYGLEAAPLSNFSLDLHGSLRTYPLATKDPPFLTIALPDATLFGSVWTLIGYNVFARMTVDGATTVLHNFAPQEGVPYGRPIAASDRNFYGISRVDGSILAMVYRISPSGALKVMATYPDGRKGIRPGDYMETLLQARNGKLYGAAALGGNHRAGAIFELALDGRLRTLYEFDNWKYGIPTSLIEASDGNIYGVAQGQVSLGGINSLFRISTAGKFERLRYIDGAQFGTCICWLTQGSDGRIFVTTQNGGPAGIGTAFAWDLGLPKPKPRVQGIQPARGAPGSSVVIWGDNLLGPTAVNFNGVAATTFQSKSKQFIEATVPTGATSGKVSVTTMNGTAISRGTFTIQ